jgi:hypothetical protein
MFLTINFRNDASLALDFAVDHGFSSVYFVWWNQDIGWYDMSIPSQFVPLRDFGRISVYKFTSAAQVDQLQMSGI